MVAAKELGLTEQTLRNWVKASVAGKLTASGSKPVTPEQMELSRLRAENARLTMHVEILKNVLRCDATSRWQEARGADAQVDLFEYIVAFYNRSRRHSPLGYSSPFQFLENWISKHAAQQSMAA